MAKPVILSEFSDHISVGMDCSAPDPVTGEIPVCHVKQSDKDSCDINLIMKRYEATGQLPDLIARDARYGDFSSVPSYQEALEIVSKAEEQFGLLPAVVRDRFANNPEEMLRFCADSRNHEEMVRMGLALPGKPANAHGGGHQPSGQPAPAPASPEAPKAPSA